MTSSPSALDSSFVLVDDDRPKPASKLSLPAEKYPKLVRKFRANCRKAYRSLFLEQPFLLQPVIHARVYELLCA